MMLDSEYGDTIVDEIHGRYVSPLVVQYALDEGWPDREAGPLADKMLRWEEMSADELEALDSLVDQAVGWLNENRCGEDESYGFHEGGFYLWPNRLWDETAG